MDNSFRITFIILSLLLSSLGLRSQDWLDQQASLQVQNATRTEVLFDLSDKYGFDLGFDGNLPGLKEKVSISANKLPVRELILRILAGTDLRFTATANRIVLRLKEKKFYTLSGFLEDASSGERLVAGSVYAPSSGRGTITNGYGFFSLSLPEGHHTILFSYLGYRTDTLSLLLSGGVSRTIELHTDNNLPEIVVSVNDDVARAQRGALGRQFTGRKLRARRSLGGEASIFDLIHQTSGSQRGADGLGGLFIRGGGADQNLVLLDDVPIFQPSHAFGLFSIINPAIVRSANFYEEGIPARFGGRLASVLDVRSLEGNTREAGTEVEISTIATKIKIERPLAGQSGAILLAARRTHLDPLIELLSRNAKERQGSLGSSSYNFYDLNLKVHRQIGEKNRVYLSFYRGKDSYRNDDAAEFEQIDEEENIIGTYFEDTDQRLRWGNTSGAVRWNYLFNDQTFANTTLTYGRYSYRSDNSLFSLEETASDTLEETTLASFSSEIEDLRLRIDIDHFADRHHWQFGLTGLLRGFIPGAVYDTYFSGPSPGTSVEEVLEVLQFPRYNAVEAAIYASDNVTLSSQWSVSAGLRLAIFRSAGSTFFGAEPRFQLSWTPSLTWSSQFSVERMQQPIHLLTSSGASLPTDLWVPANDSYGPQDSWQVGLNNQLRLAGNWKIRLVAYYRRMSGLLQYAQEANFPNLEEIPTEFWEEEVVQGTGYSVGTGTTAGYDANGTAFGLSYFYQRSFRLFAELNAGEAFPFSFDRPHKITFNLTRDLPKNWEFHLNWEFGSGRPITLVQSETTFVPLDNFAVNDLIPLSNTNDFRLPHYHRLDFAFTRNWSKKDRNFHLQLGVHNAYNRANTYYAYELSNSFSNEGPEQRNVRSLPILPSVAFGVKW